VLSKLRHGAAAPSGQLVSNREYCCSVRMSAAAGTGCLAGVHW
jgi:hypothetical protein